ncbi:MAG: hypothetical protein A2Y87_05630, partial [Bacteroidetes bacterium RBG_13_46_8]
KAEELQKIPVAGISVALQGQTSGVSVSQTTGAPGSTVKINIRGISSINQREPVWIVDGVPASPNSVNPNDVESLEILKDASSAAIYGSNGANGVILITTKKGVSGKPVVTLNYYHGTQTVPNRLTMANGPEFGAMYTELQALKNPSGIPEQNRIAAYPNTRTYDYQSLPSYNYQDMVFRNAAIDNVDLSVSGGNEKMNVYFGLGYNNQEGILKSSSFNRLNVRLNADYTVNKWFKIGENISFNKSKTAGWEEWQYLNEYESPVVNGVAAHPYFPAYDSTGNWQEKPALSNMENPMPGIELLNKAFNRYEGLGTLYIIIEPLKGLVLDSRINSTLAFTDDYDFSPTYHFGEGAGQHSEMASITRNYGKTFGYYWQNTLTYTKTFFGDFNTSIMAGYEVGESKNERAGATCRDPYTEAPEQWYFNACQDDTTLSQLPTGSGSESSKMAYVGRINFDYKSKYLLQFNLRYDKSSKFGPEKRSGTFPGFSVGWKFSEENFVKTNVPFLSFGKLRYGWGTAGIDAISDYAYFATVSQQATFSYWFNDNSLISGAGPDVLVDQSIHWEEVVTQNYGMDLSFFANKLNLTVERFERHNNGMLVRQTLPGYAGWTVRDVTQESGGVDSRPFVNIGNMSNKGWEVNSGWASSFGKLKYSANFNYSYIISNVEELGADSIRSTGGSQGISGYICRTEEGEEIGNFYGFVVERIFQGSDLGTLPNGNQGITNQPYVLSTKGDPVYAQPKAEPGDYKFKDINNDGKINTFDQVILGNPHPKHFLGLTLNLEYRMFDLSMFWEGKLGQDIFNAIKRLGYNQDAQYNWDVNYINDHYRQEDVVALDASGNTIAVFPANEDAKYPRLNSEENFNRVCSFYVEEGSYVRLKNIQLGISLPESWLNKVTLS